jgi:hypothetical protein
MLLAQLALLVRVAGNVLVWLVLVLVLALALVLQGLTQAQAWLMLLMPIQQR